MEEKVFYDQDTLRLLNRTYGTKATTVHYVAKAKKAADRLRTAVLAENQMQIMSEAIIMAEAVDMAHRLLSDDKNKIPTEDL